MRHRPPGTPAAHPSSGHCTQGNLFAMYSYRRQRQTRRPNVFLDCNQLDAAS